MTIFYSINLIVTILWVALFLREIKLMKELEEIVKNVRDELKEEEAELVDEGGKRE